MANVINVEIITPSKSFYRGKCEMVIVPTPNGEEAFMANHSFTCMLLEVGQLWLRQEGQKEMKSAFIAGGFLDVKDGIVIFTDAAEWKEDIDTARAEARKADAEAWLKNEANEEHTENEVARAQVAIARAISRLKVARGGPWGK